MSAKGMAAAARVGDRLVSGPSTDALGQRGKKKALPRKVRNPQEDAVTAAARAMIGGVLASSAGRDADEARGKLKKKRATTVLAAKLDAILTDAGVTRAHLIAVTIFIADISQANFDEMNSIYDAWIDPQSKPTRLCVQAQIGHGAAVEIRAEAACCD